MAPDTPRVLFVGEFSGHSSGYSVYAKELLTRLHAAGTYELAELACYLNDDDDRRLEMPWPVYPNVPVGDARKEYDAVTSYQFGEYRLNDVLLHFRPDVVCAFRDFWMDEAIARSPLRRHYRWVEMPTVDSAPQDEQWLATYATADAVLTYSDWGAKVLRAEGGGLIPVRGTASPGADLATFRPLDRTRTRAALGLDDDAVVIGTVMRNQHRKLYPELLRVFRRYLELAPPGLARRSYLYLHVSYPDKGWDIPRLLKRSGVSRKVLVTYKCRSCLAVTASFYRDAAAVCPSCGELAMGLPNVDQGVDRPTLAMVLNAMDAYIQYASCEGFGMPLVEAAACGIPVFATDYSAMSDVVRKLGGYPIPVDRMFTEAALGTERAYPDDRAAAEALVRFFDQPASIRASRGAKARAAAERHYTWDAAAAAWTAAIAGLTAAEPWDAPPRLHTVPTRLPAFTARGPLVDWAIRHFLGRPELAGSYLALRLLRDLSWGVRTRSTGTLYANEDCLLSGAHRLERFTPEDLFAELAKMAETYNLWERRRCSLPTR